MSGLLSHWGYFGAFIAIFAEEAGIPLPVPGDVFIAALGAAGRAHHASFAVSMVVVFVASLAGSAILFEMSRRLGHPMLLKVGRRFGFDADRAVKVERWLARRGAVAVVIGRLTPGLRIVLTVAAGALGMDRRLFIIGTGVASLLWVSIYYWLGFLLGAGVATALRSALGRAIHSPDELAALITVAVLVIGTGIGAVIWRRKRARRPEARGGGGAATTSPPLPSSPAQDC